MNRKPLNPTATLPKRHESTMQELRHERKAEIQHLDGLKKILQARLKTDSATRVA